MNMRESFPLYLASASILAAIIVFIVSNQTSLNPPQTIHNENVLSNMVGIEIIQPQEFEVVPQSTNVTVLLKTQSETNEYYWLLVKPDNTSFWWPQGDGNPIFFNNGLWRGNAVLGFEFDKGKYFEISVISVGSQSNQNFIEWFKASKQENEWPGLKMPHDARVLDNIIVLRG
jgi:hypothetical protein